MAPHSETDQLHLPRRCQSTVQLFVNKLCSTLDPLRAQPPKKKMKTVYTGHKHAVPVEVIYEENLKRKKLIVFEEQLKMNHMPREQGQDDEACAGMICEEKSKKKKLIVPEELRITHTSFESMKNGTMIRQLQKWYSKKNQSKKVLREIINNNNHR